ncbi:unnamed protein product [Cuscuta europaea]|uniref:DUF3741 domain-containing protein n=1 Tax=Cuscuta europaea TaxID=41803 RepID=A0A9P1E0L7_CUSEU|nr:unnamed protein product [Cuscuta europaea]
MTTTILSPPLKVRFFLLLFIVFSCNVKNGRVKVGTINAGVEAPRNSLELGEPLRVKTASKTMWSTLKKEEQATKILNNVSVGINQIRTSCDLSSSECSSSSPGGAKTPSLVARLMGLDLLPENNNGCSPASMCSSREDRARYLLRDQHRRSGTSSLPETPRGSLARKSDGDRHHRHHHNHHRLSLQINKENMILGSEDEMGRGRFSSSIAEKRNRNREHRENVSEMVKYVKESVSRKVGQDITNYTTKDRNVGRKEHRLDTDQVVLLKPNKPFLDFYDDFTHTKNHSPRLVSPKTENPPIKQPQKPISKSTSKENHSQKLNLQSSDIVTSYKNQPPKKQPPKKEEPFVRPANTNQENKKGCKRATPLSIPNNVPNILRPAVRKKDRLPFPTLPGKSHQKQVSKYEEIYTC